MTGLSIVVLLPGFFSFFFFFFFLFFFDYFLPFIVLLISYRINSWSRGGREALRLTHIIKVPFSFLFLPSFSLPPSLPYLPFCFFFSSFLTPLFRKENITRQRKQRLILFPILSLSSPFPPIFFNRLFLSLFLSLFSFFPSLC